METKPKTLAAKLCAIMEACHNIPKNGYNSFHKYKYVMAADAAEYVRQFMVKEKVIALPHVIKADTQKTEKGFLTELIMGYTFINAEEPSEREEVSMLGHGADSLDKSSYKANTGVHKYFLMQSFCLGGDDDPEKDAASNPSPNTRPPASSIVAKKPGPMATPRPADNLPPKAIPGAWTGEDIVLTGKYKPEGGNKTKWKDVPYDYLTYILDAPKATAETKAKANKEIVRRDDVPDFDAIRKEAENELIDEARFNALMTKD